jgi:flagellar hook-associated protein 3 FlgL
MRADPTYVNYIAQALGNATKVSNDLALQLSSGLRVNSLSDDPTGAAQSLQLGNRIAQIDSFIQTSSGETSILQVTDSTLGEVVTQITSAISLAVQASNGTLNSSNLQAISQQIIGIRDQVLGLANTSYHGAYLFAGSQGSSAPFTLDTSTSPATVNYMGDNKVQFIETSGGQAVQVSLPGASLFGSGASGIFGALNQLIDDLNSGAPVASLASDSNALTDCLGQLSTQRSILNSSLATIQSTSTYAQTEKAQLKVQQGALVSADPADIATQLKSNQVQYQALLSVVSVMQKVSLFDYMK